VKYLFIIWLFCIGARADDHWGEYPPVPELIINHFPAMGVIEISFISDSTLDAPVWYILEVKQEGDPRADWWRPFDAPLQESNFNERVSLALNYRNAAGNIQPWFNAEMIRIRVMWGA
jgi:hypothetical protein